MLRIAINRLYCSKPFVQKSMTLKHLSKALFSTSERTNALNLSGIYPPVPTPFKDNEDIHWEALKNNLKKWDNINFTGYVVQGSNGEYVLLSHQERVDMVDFVRREISNDKLILAGSGCEGTRETITLTQQMADVGADAALIATPSFFKNRMNTTAMMHHYATIADVSPIPVILYNVPSNTGVEFPLEAIFKLAKHPNVIGLKDSSGNITNIADILHETARDNFQVIAGSASFLMASLQLGAVGGICALANVMGKECCDLYSLVKENRLDDARRLQLSLIAPNQVVTRKYNVPALKYAMELLGYYGGPCRKPLSGLTETEASDVQSCFQKYL